MSPQSGGVIGIARIKIAEFKIVLRETLPERIFELRIIAQARFKTAKARPKKLLGIFKSDQISDEESQTLIGPANSANQASAWARAMGHAQSLRISQDPSQEWFRTDLEVTTAERNDYQLRIKLLNEFFSPKRRVLIESLRPIFAFRKGRQGFAPRHSVDDLILLKRMGKKVAVVFHGSDIRDPLHHAQSNPYSPFIDPAILLLSKSSHSTISMTELSIKELRPEAQELAKSSKVNRDLLPALRKNKIPRLITTPDLFHEIPDATWLPVVIDVDRFAPIAKSSAIFSVEKLRVLYIPSKSWIKSSDRILPTLEKLAAEGVIEYKNWIESGPVLHDQMPEIISQSDVVVDQFIGLFGVFALEAVAAGRVVMTFVDEAHEKYPTAPHINVTPFTLEEEIRRVVRDRHSTKLRAQEVRVEKDLPILRFHEVGLQEGIQAGIDFVYHYHDGKFSAKVIRDVMG